MLHQISLNLGTFALVWMVCIHTKKRYIHSDKQRKVSRGLDGSTSQVKNFLPSVRKTTANYILRLKQQKSKIDPSSPLVAGRNTITSQHSHAQGHTKQVHFKILQCYNSENYWTEGTRRTETDQRASTEMYQVSL